jgi:hypothetical protein
MPTGRARTHNPVRCRPHLWQRQGTAERDGVRWAESYMWPASVLGGARPYTAVVWIFPRDAQPRRKLWVHFVL